MNIPRPGQKRKSTTTRRKEEIKLLEKQVKALQAQVDQLQKNAADEASSKLSEKALETDFIRQAVLEQQASLVNVQSALSRLTIMQPGAPHETSIRLGTNTEERWATLMKMKPIKLRAAQGYLKERGVYLDDTSPFSYTTRFEKHDGFYCQIYDVVPFEGITSVKIVYDALLHFFSNMELRVTESVGDITIREDDGSSELGISQFRCISYLPSGPILETNCIICSEYKEVDEEYGGGSAVGIFTEDAVDHDELYPYDREQRIRHDGTVVTQVRAQVKKVKNAQGLEEEVPIVVMHRWAHCKIHYPPWQLSPHLCHDIREKSLHWGDAKVAAVREMVYSSGNVV